jgi:hypothetical protein
LFDTSFKSQELRLSVSFGFNGIVSEAAVRLLQSPPLPTPKKGGGRRGRGGLRRKKQWQSLLASFYGFASVYGFVPDKKRGKSCRARTL